GRDGWVDGRGRAAARGGPEVERCVPTRRPQWVSRREPPILHSNSSLSPPCCRSTEQTNWRGGRARRSTASSLPFPMRACGGPLPIQKSYEGSHYLGRREWCARCAQRCRVRGTMSDDRKYRQRGYQDDERSPRAPPP